MLHATRYKFAKIEKHISTPTKTFTTPKDNITERGEEKLKQWQKSAFFVQNIAKKSLVCCYVAGIF